MKKLCINCKHHEVVVQAQAIPIARASGVPIRCVGGTHICVRTKKVMDLVTGELLPCPALDCYAEREKGLCGESGKYFEELEK